MAEELNIFCFPHLFANQVARSSDKIALVFSGQQLTYGEINTRANQLAHYLKRRGVGPEILVGLCLDRSVEMVIGLLAILKAGGAYVPLDPAFPEERLAFMLKDSQAPVLVTQSKVKPNLVGHGCQIVYLDNEKIAVAQESEEDPFVEALPDNLAYTIYTSGSTGKPKGVQITHRALGNFLTSMHKRPGLTDRDILLATTTLSFDIAGLELFLPLVVGARLVVLSQQIVSDGTLLMEWLVNSEATVMQATPATWRLLLQAGWKGDKNLKILCGGEALQRDLADQLLVRCDSLWNMYGPTETTIWSTLDRVEAGDGPVPIGGPINNTCVFLLDSKLQRVSPGEPGELHIGGAGLARGYRNRPGLTAEKFIPDPWSNEPGARLYQTGDLACWRPDGSIAFLGRLDHQVKIRGYRIELGEIETILGQHPALRNNVVVAREDVPGDKRLVAYVVPRQNEAPTTSALRRFLKEKLPDYMIPAAFVSLRDLPLTPNGKVNRLALPVPDKQRPDMDGVYLAPRNRTELVLTKIWEKILRIRPIGVRDNFFDLGVDSLTAAHLFAKIEKAFGKRLSPGSLFHAPTIEHLADLLSKQGEKPRWSSLVAIQPHGSKPPLFCVHGGAGTILLYQDLGRRLGTEQPLYGLQMRGLYDQATPHRTVEEMATHYLNEIRTIQATGPYFLAGYCFGAIVAFEMAQQLHRMGEQVALLVSMNGPSPLYIRRQKNFGPLGKGARLGDRPKPRQKQMKRGIYKLVKSQILTFLGPALSWRMRRFAWRIRENLGKIYLHSGLPLPSGLRDTAFLLINHKAELVYLPQVYWGRMVLFYGKGLFDEPFLGWSDLVDGSLETNEIPGNHEDNRLIMEEPSIGLVAERIKDCLQRSDSKETNTVKNDVLVQC